MAVVQRIAQIPQQNAQMPFGIARSRLLTVPGGMRLRGNRFERVIFTANDTGTFTSSDIYTGTRRTIPIDLLIIVKQGVTLQPASNDTPAFNFNSFPDGCRLTLVNYGTILGSNSWSDGTTSWPGWRAISGPLNDTYLNLINYGTIAAGGSGALQGSIAIENAKFIKLTNRGTITGSVNQ